MDKKVEEKILELYEKKPYISYREVSREVSVSNRRLKEILDKHGIKAMTKREYVVKFMKNHPFYTYAAIEQHVKYGQGNVARLAKKCGINRNPHEIARAMRDEICSLYDKDPNFDHEMIVEKYGVDKKDIADAINEYSEQIRKRNHVSSREKVVELLKTTELDYTNISKEVGCDLGYVSRIAKDENLQRNCSFSEALVKNIKYYLTSDNDLSYEEIRARLNRCRIEKVISMAAELGVQRKIVKEEDEIYEKMKSGVPMDKIAEDLGYRLAVIEYIAVKFGILKRDPDKDKKVVELLSKYSTCTYTEISNLIGYNETLVAIVAEENGFNRTIISYGGDSKEKIIEMLKNNPKMTYKEIGGSVGRSSHTIWRIAKENNLSHNARNKKKN